MSSVDFEWRDEWELDNILYNAKLNLFYYKMVKIWKIFDGAFYKTETTEAISKLCARLPVRV